MIFAQIFHMVSIGIIVLDSDLKVMHWNRWMALHSGISEDQIVGASLFSFFPNLNNPRFLRSCKSVLTFGNFSFFSQKLHRYLFPFKPVSAFGMRFEHMQQSCTMGPLRDEQNAIRYLYITVQDVTEMAAYEQSLVETNMQDALTGAHNRRFLELYLNREFEKYKRYSRALSIIMIDIDFFKKINDSYGHQCGDFVLKGIAESITSAVRRIDVLARYGGEEFCCVLPETALEPAMLVAERIRMAIASNAYRYRDQSIQVTVSLGVASLDADVTSPERLVKIADEGLYAAKRGGRNAVVAIQRGQTDPQ